jgi:hypothetical protein
MKKLFKLIPLLTAFACFAQEHSPHNQISGTYILGGDHFSGVTLVLNNDSSYKVTSGSDVAGEFTGKGKWALKDDTIIFTESKEKGSVASYSIDHSWVLNLTGSMLTSKAHPLIKFVGSLGYPHMIQFECYTKSSCSGTLKLLDGYELSKPGFTYYAVDDGPVASLPDTGIYILSSNEVASLGDTVKVHIRFGRNVDTLKQMDLYRIVIMPKDHHQKGGKVWSGWFYCGKKANGHCVDYYQNGNKRVEGNFRNGKSVGKVGFYDINGNLKQWAYYNNQGREIIGAVHQTLSSLEGRYKSQSGPDAEILCLNKNHAFYDTIYFDVGGRYVFEGTWHLNNGRVILTTENAKQHKPRFTNRDTLVEKRTSYNNKILQVFNYTDSTKLIGAEVTINALKSVFNVSSDGLCILPNIPIHLIKIRFFSFANALFNVKDVNKNDFRAYIHIKALPWLKKLPITRWSMRGQNLIGVRKDGSLSKSTILIKQ